MTKDQFRDICNTLGWGWDAYEDHDYSAIAVAKREGIDISVNAKTLEQATLAVVAHMIFTMQREKGYA